MSENILYFGFASGWFLAKNKAADAKRGFRDRHKQTLFIDDRKLGTLIDCIHRDQNKIATMRHILN